MATLQKLADLVKGTVMGNDSLLINGVSTIHDGKKGTITFVAHKKYQHLIPDNLASAIIVSDGELLNGKDGIVVSHPQLAITTILKHFAPSFPMAKGVHQTAIIHPNATIGVDVSIGPYTIIEKDVSIGDYASVGANNIIESGTKIGSHSVLSHNIHIYHQSKIGNRCIIHSGAVIGSDGYGFVTHNNNHTKVPQNGNVIIGNEVEIGANCTIDRGTIGDTTIGDHCKFDNGVQIAHNVSVGKGCLLTAHVTIAGSTKIGEFCIFGGQAGAIDHVTIGDRAIFACYTAVMKDLPGGKTYSGAPAREISEKNRRDAVYIEVKKLKERLKLIEEKILS